MIKKEEIKYILYASLFAFAYFLLIIPFLRNVGIENSSPIIQFIIFNLGVFFFFQIFLKAFTLDKKLVLNGSFGILAMFMALDIWSPPLMVDYSGKLLSGAVLSASATDYVMGYLAIFLGLKGILVFLFTYILIPIILLFISAKILPNFIKNL